jgi:hypothetical protein
LKLKGKTNISFGIVSENAAISLESKCKRAGVELQIVDVPHGYVIVNDEKNIIIAIEDNNIYREVKERMLNAGVPIF